MFCFNVLLLLSAIFSLHHLYQCADDVIHFLYKVESGRRGDGFAWSLATSSNHLVVGAPRTNEAKGAIFIDNGDKVSASQGKWFGGNVDVNEHFIVVSETFSVFVYTTTRPYERKTWWIPLEEGFYVKDVAISDESMIIIAYSSMMPPHFQGFLNVYIYYDDDTYGRFLLWQKISLEEYHNTAVSLAISRISRQFLAVAYEDYSGGRVVIYERLKSTFIISQILKPHTTLIERFGTSIAMHGNDLAVSSISNNYHPTIFTYHYDPTTGQWIRNGNLFPPDGPYHCSLSLDHGILAATVTDRRDNPEVSAFVYKLTKKKKDNVHSSYITTTTTTTTNTTTNTNNSNIGVKGYDEEITWEKLATLKTSGCPLKPDQENLAVSVQGNLIFTGRRVDCTGEECEPGTVFVHDLSEASED